MLCECGTGSFKYVVDEDLGGSPRGRRRKHGGGGGGGGGGKVNPYAGRGLDRFSDVLAELETRRAKILRRVGGSDTGLVFVRFVQSNGGWTPLVVKLPEDPQLKAAAATAAKKPRPVASTAAPPPSLPPAPGSPVSPLDAAASPRHREGVNKKATTATAAATKVPARRASFSWGRRMRRPSYYWPSVIVLTLVSLAVFGRVFAICLTSIWWYVLPTLGSGGAGEDARRAGLRRSMEKKRLVSQPPHAKNVRQQLGRA